MPNSASLIQDLEHAIEAGDAARRLDALTRITDLFLSGSGHHTDEQTELFDDVFLTLVNAIEVNARAQLSKRLAPERHAPPRVVRTLAFDDAIEVAGPMLTQSEQLSEQDILDNARTKSQAHLRAITQRRALSEPVTDALIERGDSRVVQLVVKNAGAHFSEAGFGALVDKAASDDDLARFVGARHDIPRQHFLKLLETASAEVRSRLVASNPALATTVYATVSDIASGISAKVRSKSKGHARARARIKRLRQSGQFSEADLHAFANAHDFERTALALSTLGEFPIELVERALVDAAPDLAMVLCKAAKCCRATVRAILLMRSEGRGLSPMDLDQMIASYDRLKTVTARRALEFYRMRLNADDSGHAPAHLAMSWFAESLPEQQAAEATA